MEYIKLGTGSIPSKYDVRDYFISKDIILDKLIFPKSFYYKPLIVKNQEDKKTCVAHSLSEIIEFHNLKDTGNLVRFSTQFIYGMRDPEFYQGEGMRIRDGLKIIQKYGDVVYRKLPGNTDVETAKKEVGVKRDVLISHANPHRISTYYKIKTAQELRYAIKNHGPVVTGMKLYSGSSLDNDKIYRFDLNQKYTTHAVVILGWDNDNWYVQNSWGSRYGKDGCFYIPQKGSFEHVFFDTYGITDKISEIDKKEYNSIVYKILNAFANLFKLS